MKFATQPGGAALKYDLDIRNVVRHSKLRDRRKFKFTGNPHRRDVWVWADLRSEHWQLMRPDDGVRQVDWSMSAAVQVPPRGHVDTYRREIRKWPSGVRRVRYVYVRPAGEP